VLRSHQTVAKFLTPSPCGERSLIKNQIRYAGIRATSDILKCCRIDREQFEQALGPLEKVLPDQYRYISGGNFSGFFQASTS
jgi:CRP-like cAMP-binding protein